MSEKSFNYLRDYFFDFYENVKLLRNKTPHLSHAGHGLEHDLTVATFAVKIAKDQLTGQKAWCAGLLHSFDRMVDDKDVKKVMIEHAKNLEKIFSQDDIHEIVEAAYRHSERNQTDQSETQITLMDADRLANMQSAVIIRGGQFRPTLPALDFNYLEGAANPLSTYERPMTVLDNLRFIIYNFPPQLRLPEAKRLGVIYTDRLSSYIKSVEDDHKELGLKNISF